jgi:hypothetical protein
VVSVKYEAVLRVYEDCRKYLGYETNITPIPRQELVEQLKAEGYGRREARDTLDLLIERGDFVCIDETVVAIKNGETVEVSGSGVRPAKDSNETTQNPTYEPGSSESEVSNPRVDEGEDDTDSSDRSSGECDEEEINDRVLEAFETAVEYMHEQLDRDISDETGEDGPDTPREYFEDVRGWDPETVEEKRLGYAPASR